MFDAVCSARRRGPSSSERVCLASGYEHLRPASFALRPTDVVILFSDGVAGRFRKDDYPSLGLDPAPAIAFNVVSRFGKGMDDASCAVMRCRW